MAGDEVGTKIGSPVCPRPVSALLEPLRLSCHPGPQGSVHSLVHEEEASGEAEQEQCEDSRGLCRWSVSTPGRKCRWQSALTTCDPQKHRSGSVWAECHRPLGTEHPLVAHRWDAWPCVGCILPPWAL